MPVYRSLPGLAANNKYNFNKAATAAANLAVDEGMAAQTLTAYLSALGYTTSEMVAAGLSIDPASYNQTVNSSSINNRWGGRQSTAPYDRFR